MLCAPRTLVVLLSFAAALARGEFLPADAIDYRQLVPPPPAAGSVEEEADLLAVTQAEANRTPEQVALAKRYERIDIFKMIQPVLGDWATAETLPKLAAFFKKAVTEARPLTEAAKNAYARPRPHVLLPTLHPAIDKPEGFSYPSGHATGAAMYAALLSAIAPEHAAEWEHQAELVRLSRLYGGAHFPTDLIAGQRLGQAVARAMLKSPAAQQALVEVRAELAAALAARRKAA